MICRESWYRESLSLDGVLRSLQERVLRGDSGAISPYYTLLNRLGREDPPYPDVSAQVILAEDPPIYIGFQHLFTTYLDAPSRERVYRERFFQITHRYPDQLDEDSEDALIYDWSVTGLLESGYFDERGNRVFTGHEKLFERPDPSEFEEALLSVKVAEALKRVSSPGVIMMGVDWFEESFPVDNVLTYLGEGKSSRVGERDWRGLRALEEREIYVGWDLASRHNASIWRRWVQEVRGE